MPADNPNDPNRLISASEAAEILGVTKAMVPRYFRNGQLPGTRVGPKNLVFRLGDVQAFTPQPPGWKPGKPRGPRPPRAKKAGAE